MVPVYPSPALATAVNRLSQNGAVFDSFRGCCKALAGFIPRNRTLETCEPFQRVPLRSHGRKTGYTWAMDKRLPDDPNLARLKRDLEALYGPGLKQVLLYGSRARGDHREESDYDVLVVLDGTLDWRAEMEQLAKLSTRIGIETAGMVILSLKAVTPDDLQKRTGFMHNIRNEAISI